MKTFCETPECNHESAGKCSACGLLVCSYHSRTGSTLKFDVDHFWTLRSQLKSVAAPGSSSWGVQGTYRHFYEHIFPAVTLPGLISGFLCEFCYEADQRKWRESIDRALLPAVRRGQERGLLCQFDLWCLVDSVRDHRCSRCSRLLCLNHCRSCRSCEKLFCVRGWYSTTRTRVRSGSLFPADAVPSTGPSFTRRFGDTFSSTAAAMYREIDMRSWLGQAEAEVKQLA